MSFASYDIVGYQATIQEMHQKKPSLEYAPSRETLVEFDQELEVVIEEEHDFFGSALQLPLRTNGLQRLMWIGKSANFKCR